MIEFAAIVASIILAALAVFQVALIIGAPIGRFAWGGQHDVLPTKLRIASASSILLYGIFALVALASAGIMAIPISSEIVVALTWILTGYFCLGIVMNGISRSKPERMLMTPVAAILALLFLYIALQ